MKLPEGKSRLDLVREGLENALGKRGRFFVSLDKLIEDPNNERKTFRNMQGLVASIKAVGLVEPITVSAEQGGAYRILTGHRRYRAAKAAGLQNVEVLIRDKEDERDRRLKSLVSNVQREDIGPVEMAEALQSLLDEDNEITSQRELAKVIGKDETWVSRMLRILDLPTQLQAKLATSQVSITYDAVATIARLEGREEQEQLVEMLLAGATNRDIRGHINVLRGGGKKDANIDGSIAEKPKPKRVYHTAQKATVIVQSKSSTLSSERVITALEEALSQAKKAA